MDAVINYTPALAACIARGDVGDQTNITGGWPFNATDMFIMVYYGRKSSGSAYASVR